MMENIIDLISNPDLLPQRERHYGIFYGVVEDNHDPLQLGRLRVRVPHYQGFPINSIPWATYSAPGNGGWDRNGFYFIPEVGSCVTVIFLGGMTQYPVWLGAVPGIPDGIPDTFVSRIDPQQPYGQAVEGWDYVKFHSITTQSGHRLIFDDNETEQGNDVRRIMLESARGHYLRIVDSKNSNVANEHNALIEIATVRDSTDLTAIRRISLDNDLEKIIISGPDTADSGVHEITISSPEDHIKAKTNRGYTLVLDDQNELVDLFTTLPGTSDTGFRMRFDNPAERMEIKSLHDRFAITCLDTPSGYIAMSSPYDLDTSGRRAGVFIDRRPYGDSGDPVIVISSGDDIAGSNGILVDPGSAGQRPQAVTIYGKGVSSDPLPDGYEDVVQVVSKSNGTQFLDGQITIGKLNSSNTIRLTPSTSLIQLITSKIQMQASSSVIVTSNLFRTQGGDAVLDASSLGNRVTLKSQYISMEGPTVHNYFRHYHDIDLSHPDNIGKWSVELAPGLWRPVLQNNSNSSSSSPLYAVKTNPPNSFSPWPFPLGL